MSNLANNTTTLQVILDAVNALPEAENLDSELATQDTLIADIQTALATKAAPSGGKQVAIGTMYWSYTDQTDSFTVSDLGFTPTDAIIVLSDYYVENRIALWSAKFGSISVASELAYGDGAIETDVQTSFSGSSVTFGTDSVTFGTDGIFVSEFTYMIVGE